VSATSRLPKRRARGLTLTEMMVGLSAGLLVTMAGVSSLLLARQGFTTTSEQSLNFDAGRLGIDLVARNVRMAGSPPFDPATVTTATSFELPNGDLALGGTEGGDAPDTLTVRYWSNQAYDAARMVGADCLGQAVGVGLVVNTFSVTDNGELGCVGNGTGATATATPVASHVTDLQVRYGLAATAADHSAVRFVDATTVTSDAAWNRVRTVELCVEVAAPDARAGAGASPGLNCRGQAFPNDNRLRKTYRTTVNVRNFTAGNIFPGNAMP
jgi:type IV pilus assembly protein PilW